MLPSRRQVLVGAAAALVSACTADREAERPGPTAPPDPAAALLAAAAARERALLAAYDDVLSRYPDLAPVLSPYREDHAAHLHALEPGAVVSATVTPSARKTPRRTQAAVRRRLRQREQAAAAAYTRVAITAAAPHAALLASLAACEATHAELLA